MSILKLTKAFSPCASKCQNFLTAVRLYGEKKIPAPTITLNDGRQMPMIGIDANVMRPGKIGDAVKYAFNIGYRHLDCAFVYGNERELSCAIGDSLRDGTSKREDLWVTSKLWNNFHRPKSVRKACELTLKNLGLDYVDLYVIHWPMAFKEDWNNLFFTDARNVVYSDVDYVHTWKAMEDLYYTGLCKSIGLSNFNKRQIERIMKVARVPPAVNQVECHPYLTHSKLSYFYRKRQMKLIANNPAGSPRPAWSHPDEPVLLEDPKIRAIADKYRKDKKTMRQVLLRFQIELGNATIPKWDNKDQIKSNFEIFDFKLEDIDFHNLKAMNRDYRYDVYPEVANHPDHPFVCGV